MSNLASRRSLVHVLLLFVVGLLVMTQSERLGQSAPFTVNPTRFDPYKNFKFRVKWDGRVIPGVAYVSPLRRSTGVVEHREGGDFNNVRKSPGITHFDPITLQHEGWERDKDVTEPVEPSFGKVK